MRRSPIIHHMKNKISVPLPIIGLACSILAFSVSSCSRAPEGPPKTVAVNADDKMKFDLTAFEVAPGQKVIVTFKNVGTTPKFSMGHNFVLLDRAVNVGNVQTFLDKASMEAAHDYVPPGALETARSQRNRHGDIHRPVCSRRIPLSLLVSRALLPGDQRLHDSEVNVTT